MKLIEALGILKSPAPEGSTPWDVALACGFTPGHLETLLAAELRLLAPGRRPAIRTGLYGDALGNLERLAADPPEAVACVLEWPDLDPRLGLRHLGGWGIGELSDILETAAARLEGYRRAIERVAASAPLALCLPTLALPPVSYLPGGQAGSFELGLRAAVASFAARLAAATGVAIVDAQRLDELSPHGERPDVRADLSSGFPYRVPHASAVAGLLAGLLVPRPPRKGLITDLDDTVWRGLLGEVGPEGISWDLDHRSQIHGLYQQMLASLAEAGVLVAVASKNDPELVEAAFRRPDLLLKEGRVFPVEAGWGPKSEAVGRILARWNVGADAVVFLDDNPMELAEVKAAHPEVDCLLFPRDDEAAAYELLRGLRDAFGKPRVSEEDGLRLESLRRSAEAFGDAGGQGTTPDAFLEQARAVIALDFAKDPPGPRALELVNKTNQFNLNGRRYTEGEWLAHLKGPDSFLMTVSYKDKFGPLGAIAVVTGRAARGVVAVDQWVMSCRAFSRRIEHRTLAILFERFSADRITFDFQATPRNGPLRGLLSEFIDDGPGPGCAIAREVFESRCPPLYHEVEGPRHD